MLEIGKQSPVALLAVLCSESREKPLKLSNMLLYASSHILKDRDWKKMAISSDLEDLLVRIN